MLIVWHSFFICTWFLICFWYCISNLKHHIIYSVNISLYIANLYIYINFHGTVISHKIRNNSLMSSTTQLCLLFLIVWNISFSNLLFESGPSKMHTLHLIDKTIKSLLIYNHSSSLVFPCQWFVEESDYFVMQFLII